MKKIFGYSLLLILVSSCAVRNSPGKIAENNSLKFLNIYTIPHRMRLDSTVVGGLSSIDYDRKTNRYYLICDDRSALSPARFYTASIRISEKGIDTVILEKSTYLKTPEGNLFPDTKTNPFRTPDPEGLRYNQKTNLLVWTSEGERIVSPKRTVVVDPWIYRMKMDGSFIDSFPLPVNLHMSATESGFRQNGVFEGLCFTPDYKKLYVSIEEPIYQDGARASVQDSGTIRIIEYNTRSMQPGKQYGYRIDPVQYPSVPKDSFQVNGVPDILYVGNHHLLVTERSFSSGRKQNDIRLYLADLSGATDISGRQSLAQEAPTWNPIRKQLLLNLNSLGIYIDNIEGATFGPRLPNGHQTLIVVADDNFQASEQTQFLVFEIL